MTNEDNTFGEDLRQAVEVLRRGGLILYPTDTVWGIGCDATNEDAVHRVYSVKGRRDNKALITLVGDLGVLERTVDAVPDIAYDLIECSDRPLTIVYDRGRGVAPALMGEGLEELFYRVAFFDCKFFFIIADACHAFTYQCRCIRHGANNL